MISGQGENNTKHIQKHELHIQHVCKTFETENGVVQALENINLDIGPGEFVSIVGASGCGKSTLLKMMLGLENPTEGQITIGSRTVTKPSVDVGMVFQEARLYPWLNIEKNIEFGAPENMSKEEKRKKAKKYIDLVNLDGFEQAYPSQLSGGMQQRAGIARALIGNPEVLLLDEPFGALDAFTRITMQNEVLRVWEHEHKTMVLVTHDIDEAIFLSDRIVILSDRPGSVKEIIPVNLSRPRDRSSNSFLEIRKKILMSFLGKTEVNVEYYI